MTSPYNDEITLIDLFLIIKKRFKLLVILCFISIVVSGIVSVMLKPVFRTSFIMRMPNIVRFPVARDVVEYTFVSNIETENIITGLEVLRKEQRIADLAQRLGLTPAMAAGVVKISASRPSTENSMLQIIVDVRDPSVINEFTAGLLNYLNQHKFIQDRISLQKENLMQLKKDIQTSIGDMEELNNAVSRQIKQNGITFLGFDPIQMNKDIVEAKQSFKEVENAIALLRGFEAVTEPVIPQYPLRSKKLLPIGIATAASFFIGVFVSVVAEWVDRRRKLAATR